MPNPPGYDHATWCWRYWSYPSPSMLGPATGAVEQRSPLAATGPLIRRDSPMNCGAAWGCKAVATLILQHLSREDRVGSLSVVVFYRWKLNSVLEWHLRIWAAADALGIGRIWMDMRFNWMHHDHFGLLMAPVGLESRFAKLGTSLKENLRVQQVFQVHR